MLCPDCEEKTDLAHLCFWWGDTNKDFSYICEHCGQNRTVFPGESELDRLTKAGISSQNTSPTPNP